MAHVFDTNLRQTGAGNPFTFNYTCGSGSTLLVLGLVVGNKLPRNGDAPTYNGVELTQADETRRPPFFPTVNQQTCELWYLLTPDTESALEISIPNPSSYVIHAQVSSWIAAEGTSSELDVEGGKADIGTNPSVTLTTTTDGSVIVGVLGNGDTTPPSTQTGTSLNITDNGLYSDSNQYVLQVSAGAQAIGWTTSVSADYCLVAAGFKQTNTNETVTPDAFELTLTLQTPSVTADADVSVGAPALALTVTIETPVVSIDYTQSPSALTLTDTLFAPSLLSSTSFSPDVLELTLTLNPITVFAEQSATIITESLDLSLTIEPPNSLAPLDTVRMIPFIFSSSVAYMMEFGNEYIRFYFDGDPLLDGGTHVEISTDYQSSELLELQYKQSADVMWITHPNHPPAKLKRLTTVSFEIEDIEFINGPFIERNDIANDDGVTMNVSVTGNGEAGILTRSSGTFEAEHIGALFKLTHPRADRRTSGSATNTGIIGEAIEVLGDYTFSVTTENWFATIKLQRSTDDWVTSSDIVTYTDRQKHTFKNTENTENVQYRINVTTYLSGTISASLSVNSNSVTGSATAVGVIKTPVNVKGAFNFNTHGNWDATVVLERNENEGGWEPFRTYTSRIVNSVGSRNVQFEQVEESDNVRYRINVISYNSGTVQADLSASSSNQSGVVRIDAIESNVSADVTVVVEVSQTTDTIRWAEGAWSDLRGYPSAVTFFEERVVYGFTDTDQQNIWLSETARFEDFEAGVNDADSFTLTLPTADRGRWFGSIDQLTTGTAGDEWRVKVPLDEPLTPTNWSMRKQSSYGSANLQSIEVGSVILFIDSVGRKIREFVFREQEQKHVAPDLTSLAEHITVSGIVNFAHQKNPDSLLWCVLDNGNLITLSYEREQNVVAWALMPIDGLVQSVAVIPSSLEDEVWISVVRAIDGDTKIYVEQFQTRTLDIRLEKAFFVDSGIIYDGPLTDVITGLGHLEAKTVSILADGVVLDNQVVTGGQVTLTTQARNVRIGLPFISKVIPMRMDVSTTAGTTHGSIKKIPEMVISFKDTVGAKYGKDDASLFDIDFDKVGLKNISDIEGLFTGDVTVHFDGGFDIDDSMVISQSDPLPCVVRGIVPRVRKTGR